MQIKTGSHSDYEPGMPPDRAAQLGGSTSVHYLPITDAMRESVTTHGQARFMPRETDSAIADRVADEKASRYFEIGQADDEAMKNNDNWIYDPSSRAIKSKKGGTHGSNFTHEVADRSFKGWFDHETDTISVVFPAHELRKLDGEPTVDDIPSSVFNALRSKFGKTAKLVAFMPRGAGPAAEDIAEPPGLTRTPFKAATLHRKRRLEDIPALAK